MNSDSVEAAKHARLVQDAFTRGQAGLADGDKTEAVRWLDRAHRLAPNDGTIALVLASAAIGADNARAEALFAEVLAAGDVRDAWLGLATARYLTGDLAGARAAVSDALGRYVVWPDLAALADRLTRLADAPGWCGVTSEGAVVVRQVGSERIEIRMDGKAIQLFGGRGRSPHTDHDRPLRTGHDPTMQTRHGPVSHYRHGPVSHYRHGPARPGHQSTHIPGLAGGPVKPGHDGGERPGHDGGERPGHDGGERPSHDGGERPSHDGFALPGRDGDEVPGYGRGEGPGHTRDGRPGRDPCWAQYDNPMTLPPRWPRARSLTVMAIGSGGAARHLIGSPISLREIARVDGNVESYEGGLRGWAWHPADPETTPLLVAGAGRARTTIVAAEPVSIPGLPPLARPRSFAIPWAELPAADSPVHLRGRDGRDLQGSPVVRYRAESEAAGHPNDPATPSTPGRRKHDLTLWHDEGTEAVILVTHDDGGGVERRVQASVASHEALGRRAIVLRPAKSPEGSVGTMVSSLALPNLRFDLPREQRALLRLLRRMSPVAAEMHHFLNHDASVFEIIQALGVPFDAHTHDYAWFCPRIALVGRGDRYCGEPAPSACETCIAKLGGYLHEHIPVPALLDRSRSFLSGAQRIVAPSHDAAARLARHFPGLSPEVIPHEDDQAVAEPPPIPEVPGIALICVAGAIGLHKGFDILLACARDAKRRALDLSFVVAGTTIDDQSLMDTGRVFVTGPYQPAEAVALIRAQGAALALLPSIWPETWCLGLTELWRAGLRVAAFDIGAPAERISQTGRGFLMPLGLAPSAINDTLLKSVRGRSLLPIRRASAYNTSRCNHKYK